MFSFKSIRKQTINHYCYVKLYGILYTPINDFGCPNICVTWVCGNPSAQWCNITAISFCRVSYLVPCYRVLHRIGDPRVPYLFSNLHQFVLGGNDFFHLSFL